MSFQTSVQFLQAAGVPGELFAQTPLRAESYTLVSALASYNAFSSAFTVTAQGVAAAGNAAGTPADGVFAGILCNPKEHASFGGSAGPLSPSFTLANNTQASLLVEGTIYATLANNANVGDAVIYDNTTGLLASIAPGVALPVGKSSAYAYVNYYDITTGIAVISVNYVPTIPVLA